MATAPSLIPDFSGQLPTPADPDTFTDRGLAWWNYERYTAFPGMNSLAANAYGNAVAAEESAATAATLAGAAMWNAEINYTTGQAAISPTDLQTYRRKSPGGVDATDPASSSNWVQLSGDSIKKSGDTAVGPQSFATGGYVSKDQYMNGYPSFNNVYVPYDPVFQTHVDNSNTFVGAQPKGSATVSGYYATAGSSLHWGGFFSTSTGLEVHSAHQNTPNNPVPIRFKFSGVEKFTVYKDGTFAGYGMKGRQGTAGATSGNNINFWWTGTEMQVWVDATLVGTLNITPP